MIYDIFDFLPYRESSCVRDLNDRLRTLKLLKYLYGSFIRAIQSMKQGDSRYFDPQVGEAMCQIRAYYLFLETNSIQKRRNLNEKLTIVKNTISTNFDLVSNEIKKYKKYMEHPPSYYVSEINSKVTLSKFVNCANFNIFIDELTGFIFLSFILSNHKIINDYQICSGIDYDALRRQVGIDSRQATKKFICRLQVNLSRLSSSFVLKLSNDVRLSSQHHKFLRVMCYSDESGRETLPCYESMRVIMNHLKCRSHEIAIISHRENDSFSNVVHFKLKYSKDSDSYKIASSEDRENPCILIYGRTYCKPDYAESTEDYIERFLKVGFENILLWNAAQHPQYPGKKLYNLRNNPYFDLINTSQLSDSISEIKKLEYQFVQSKCHAFQFGCHFLSPSLFLATHIKVGLVQL